MDELDVIEHRLAAAPRLVPVKPYAPDITRSLRVSEDGSGSLIDEITIVIPGNYLLITEPFLFHRRAEIVFQKVSLFLSRVDTRLPRLSRHRFVLNRDAPDGYAF